MNLLPIEMIHPLTASRRRVWRLDLCIIQVDIQLINSQDTGQSNRESSLISKRLLSRCLACPRGYLKRFFKQFIPGATYLDASDTPAGALTIDHPDNLMTGTKNSNTLIYDSSQSFLNPTLICADAAALIGADHNFPNNTVRYSQTGLGYPNSNSFVRYLLTFTYGLGITAPPGSIGWNDPVLGR